MTKPKTERHRLSLARTRAEESLEMALEHLVRVSAEGEPDTFARVFELAQALSMYHDAKKHADEANRVYHAHVALEEFKAGA